MLYKSTQQATPNKTQNSLRLNKNRNNNRLKTQLYSDDDSVKQQTQLSDLTKQELRKRCDSVNAGELTQW